MFVHLPTPPPLLIAVHVRELVFSDGFQGGRSPWTLVNFHIIFQREFLIRHIFSSQRFVFQNKPKLLFLPYTPAHPCFRVGAYGRMGGEANQIGRPSSRAARRLPFQ